VYVNEYNLWTAHTSRYSLWVILWFSELAYVLSNSNEESMKEGNGGPENSDVVHKSGLLGPKTTIVDGRIRKDRWWMILSDSVG
jgi:hypothetical protein